MALNIPTTAATTAANLASYEAKLGQNAPINDRAYLRVQSAVEAMLFTALYKYGAQEMLGNLAITAPAGRLEIIGANYGVTRIPAEAAILRATLTGAPGTTIPISAGFVGDDNRVTYRLNASYVLPAPIEMTANVMGEAGNLIVGQTLSITAPVAGAGSTATITAILNAGVEQEDLEVYRSRVLTEIRTQGGGSNLSDYREWVLGDANFANAFPYSGLPITYTVPFVDGDMEAAGLVGWTAGHSALLTKSAAAPHGGLQALRVEYNGVNAPYATQSPFSPGQKYLVEGWARGDATYAPCIQNQLGVSLWVGTNNVNWQAFSINFTASDVGLIFGSDCVAAGWVEFDDVTIDFVDMPGQRTVYVQVIPAIEPDGIPPMVWRNAARALILVDPDTGLSRPCLGTIDAELFVEPIIRTGFDVQINHLVIAAELLADVQSKILAALTTYFSTRRPFIVGLDFEGDSKNVITQTSVSEIVQDTIAPHGGSADSVLLRVTGGLWTPAYTLAENELSKNINVTYA